MKKIVLILALIGLYSPEFAQDKKANKNNVFLELWGSANLFSLNYERIYLISPTINMTSRIGGSYLKIFETDLVSCPISFSTLLGKDNHRIELGISCAYRYFRNSEGRYNNLIYGIIIGYRLQPITEHIIIRITYTPIFATSLTDNNYKFFHRGGFSFGYSF